MPQQRGPGLSLAEWLVLCLVNERPTHGFAIAGLVAEDGSLGRIWHVRKMVVYRAAHRLEQLGLIVASDRQPTSQGPCPGPAAGHARGPPGRRSMAAPGVADARDIRSELLLKMALLDRVAPTPGTCCGPSAASSPPSPTHWPTRSPPPPGLTRSCCSGGTNRSRLPCGFSTPCWPRCPHHGLGSTYGWPPALMSAASLYVLALTAP